MNLGQRKQCHILRWLEPLTLQWDALSTELYKTHGLVNEAIAPFI